MESTAIVLNNLSLSSATQKKPNELKNNEVFKKKRKRSKKKKTVGPEAADMGKRPVKSEQLNPTIKSVNDISRKASSGDHNWKKFLEASGSATKPKIVKKSQQIKKKDKKDELSKVLAMDCEMVGIGEEGKDNMLARVSIVNNIGICVYDKFVKPQHEVVDYRTEISGVRPSDLERGEEFHIVQKEVKEILKDRILVGHSLKNDLEVLSLKRPHVFRRDTALFFKKPGHGTPSLKRLAKEYLGENIQEGEHNSIIDAQAAMNLYNMFRVQWEQARRNPQIPTQLLPSCNLKL